MLRKAAILITLTAVVLLFAYCSKVTENSPTLPALPSSTPAETAPSISTSASTAPPIPAENYESEDMWYDWEKTGAPPKCESNYGFRTKVTSDGENIYFFKLNKEKDELDLIKTSPDGSNKVIINKQNDSEGFFLYNLIYYKGWIFYSINRAFYKIKPDGTEKVKIYEGSKIFQFLIVDGNFYFQDNYTGDLSCCDMDGNLISYDNMENGYLCYDSKKLYFIQCSEEEYYLKALNIDSGLITNINYNIKNDCIAHIIVNNGILYSFKDPYYFESYNIESGEINTISLKNYGQGHDLVLYKGSLLFFIKRQLFQYNTNTKEISMLCNVPYVTDIYSTRAGIYLDDDKDLYKLKEDNGQYSVVPITGS